MKAMYSVAAAAAAMISAPVAAQTITSYDVVDQGWSDTPEGPSYLGYKITYNGQFTPGRPGVFSDSYGNLTGGSGSLNDRVIDYGNTGGAHLFDINELFANTSLTFYLDNVYLMDTITLFSDWQNIGAFDVTIGNQTRTYQTGINCFNGTCPPDANVIKTALGVPLSLIPTNSFTLSNWRKNDLATADFATWTALAEVQFTGRVFMRNAVPEPATWAMLIFGFAVIGAARRRREAAAFA